MTMDEAAAGKARAPVEPWRGFLRLSRLFQQDDLDLEVVLTEAARIVASVWNDRGEGVARIEAEGLERSSPGYEAVPGLSFAEIDHSVWIQAGSLHPGALSPRAMSPSEEETFLAAVGRRIHALLHRRRVLAAASRRDGSLLELLDLAPLGMALVGPEHQLVRVNRPLGRILGYSEAELLGRTIVDLTHPDDIGKDVRQVDRLFRREIPSYQMEKRFIRKDGRILWGWLTATLHRDPDGLPIAVVGMIEDITWTKKIEERFRGQEPDLPETVEVQGEEAGARAAETILVVEDDPVVRRFVCQILLGGGYRVMQARDGLEALRFCEDVGGRVDLLLTDVVMNGLTGREVVERLRPMHPEMAVLYMSGYPDSVLAARGLLDPGSELLEKPFTVPQLLRKVRVTLDENRPAGA